MASIEKEMFTIVTHWSMF